MTGRVKFFRDTQKLWRWHVVARNGRIIADSAEGYERYGNCVRGFIKAKATFAAIPEPPTTKEP